MSVSNGEQLASLVSLVQEVKPGLADVSIKAEDSLVEHLGLDSLDILQLSRKVNKTIGMFDLDSWNASGKGSLQSILDQINGIDAVVPQPDYVAT